MDCCGLNDKKAAARNNCYEALEWSNAKLRCVSEMFESESMQSLFNQVLQLDINEKRTIA